MTQFSPMMVDDRRHADVDFLAVDVDRELTVLGAASLDDVHVGHDLDPTDQARARSCRELQDLLQRTVDAKPHANEVLGRLDVHVRGAVAHRLGEDAIHDLNDRCVVGGDSTS